MRTHHPVKLWFWSDPENGMASGYGRAGSTLGFEGFNVVDVASFLTSNEALRHLNYLRDFPPDDGVRADWNFHLDTETMVDVVCSCCSEGT